MTDHDFAKLLGRSDALEVAHQIDLMKKEWLAARNLSDAEEQVEGILSDVYYSSKAKHPQIFRDDMVNVYQQSLAENLRRLGYMPRSPVTPTLA
jgi:tRNA G10  N-methylase Trm11